MAIIVDPDDLNQGVEIDIDTSAKTITLNTTGNLSDDGVTGQALYSFLKEEWRTDSSLIQFLPPFEQMLTSEQIEWVNGWTPANDATRNLLRFCGWREIDATGSLTREYLGVVSLGNIDATDTAYYAFASDSAKTDFDFPGTINQGVQTFGDASNGNFDKRSEVLSIYIRIQGKLYGVSSTTDIGLTSIPYNTQRFPLSESPDLKITASDNDIDTLAPYTGMSITYGTVTRNIGGANYNFNVLIDGNNGTAEQIYEFVQRELRKSSDIDDGAGTVIGELAESLLEFVGDTLKTKNAYIDNFQANDTNRIIFGDDTGAEIQFPFVAAGTLNFNVNLQNDPDSVYRMFFSAGFGTPSAILVNDNDGDPISGDVSGASFVGFDFDYDNNNQGGRTPGTDAPITVVAIGESGAQYVLAEGVITRAVGQSVSLVAPFERNYSNP
jgi:hypothetical protein